MSSLDLDFDSQYDVYPALFQIGSYLVDPICKAREFIQRFYIAEQLNPTDLKIVIWIKKVFLLLGAFFSFCLSIFTTLPGLAIRSIAAYFQKNPFLHLKGLAEEKILENNKFTLLSWNVCCVEGGYAISDGGVTPPSYRLEKIAVKVLEKNADVVCLYEVFDVNDALYFYERLKSQYAHIYLNIGPNKGMGTSSGLFVASKYPIKNPKFVLFPKEFLVGRTKYCEKGFFSFELRSKKTNFAKVITTHLQHSEVCCSPEKIEKKARKNEMLMIMQEINQISKATILTGDLNLDEEEYEASWWKDSFKRDNTAEKSWGGDGFSARLVQKKVSLPLNFDYTLLTKDSNASISTELIDTGYDGEKFINDALSDHKGLLSTITLTI